MVIVLIFAFGLLFQSRKHCHGSATMTPGHASFRHSETNFCKKNLLYEGLTLGWFTFGTVV
jgi:hypothetical protein